MVLVFGRRYQIPLSKLDVEEAWRTIPAIPSQGRASFSYPSATTIGVFYTVGSTTILHGPHQADPGTTWIYEEVEHATALTQSRNRKIAIFYQLAFILAPYLPLGAPSDVYVITNKQSTVSPGRIINVALYKDEKPIMVKRGLGVGNCVQMKLSDSLYICCMEVVADGDDLMYFIVEYSPMTSINLTKYPQGVDLIINRMKLQKKYSLIKKQCLNNDHIVFHDRKLINFM